MILTIAICFVGVVLVGFAAYLFFRRKPVKALRAGDYVMFKPKYKNLFPQVPTTHAILIEKIIDDQAIVVFMTLHSISKATMPLYVLSRAV